MQMKIVRLFSALIFPILIASCITPAGAPVSAGEQAEEAGGIRTAETAESNEQRPPVPDEEDRTRFETDDKTESEPAVELLPALTPAQLNDRIRELMPWNMSIVSDSGSPLIIHHDLDKNGYEDALVVAVEGGDVNPDLTEFSKTARLFQSERPSNFLLKIFYQHSGDVRLRYTVPVSRQLVFDGIEVFEIRKGSDFPYSIRFHFRTRAGIEDELVILSGYGITHFTIKENLSEITIVEDIDQDGYNDIIVHEQGFEEGTGFETFLTWYKWNLREYTEYRSTNIVRNLREFFLVCTEELRAGELGSFLDYALDSEAYSGLKKQGYSDADIVSLIFRSADGGESDPGWFEDGGFTTVVFPDLMETPFSYANRNDFRHQVAVRFGRPGGESRIFLAELIMNRNPFQDKQFCFCIK